MRHKFTVKFEVEIDFDSTDMTIEQAVSEVTESMHFPCEDTENVDIIEHRIVTGKAESADAKKPFVHLTIDGHRNNEAFKAATGLLPDNAESDFDTTYFRYDDIDIADNLPEVVRALGGIDGLDYQLTTEEQ